MLQYNRNYVLKRINTNEVDSLRECIISHFWHIFGIKFRFSPKVYDGCHGMTEEPMSFNNVVIVIIGKNYYGIHFWFVV